jgi:hypothetical protein
MSIVLDTARTGRGHRIISFFTPIAGRKMLRFLEWIKRIQNAR